MWSLAIRCTNTAGSSGPISSSFPFTDSAAYTRHLAQFAMQVVLPDAHGAITLTLLESPARLAPSHTTTTWPLESAATQGNTFAKPSVAPWLMIRAGVQVVP